MNIRKLMNLYRKGYSYFHRNERCAGQPEVFAIEATNACMMDCEMCPRREMTRPVGHMDLELFKKIIDEAQEYSEWIWLHLFGDPLLHPQIDQLIRYAKSKGIKTRISTNPNCLTEQKSRAIIDAGLDLIHIALDGVDNESYQSVRGKNAHYDQALVNITRLVQIRKEMGLHKPIIRVAIIRMEKTKAHIDEFKRFWSDKGVDEIKVINYITWDGSVQRIIDFAGDSNLSSAYKNPIQRTCLLPWLSVAIMWDGRVVPCCFDSDGKNVLGDLNHQTLKEIWNSQPMLALRKQHISFDYANNNLCAYCKEKKGAPPSRFFPFNLYVMGKIYNIGLSRIRTLLNKESNE
jgi:radical SAM protein with 4Fe4S-binding SPASM domain